MSASRTCEIGDGQISTRAIALCLFLGGLAFGTYLPIDYDRMIAGAGAGLLLCFKSATIINASQKENLRDALLLGGVTLITVWTLLTSEHRAVALVGAASWLFTWRLGAVARTEAYTSRIKEMLFASIALGGAMATLYVWIARHFPHPDVDVPLFLHQRLMGMHLAAATLAGLAWLHCSETRGRLRVVQWIAAIIPCAGMLWSGGRSPIIAVGAGMFFLLFAVGTASRWKLFRQGFVVMVAALLLSAANWTSNPALGWWNAISRSAEATTVSALTSTRSDFWMITAKYIRDAPVLGHGPDFYRFVRPRQDGQQPHNFLLQWLLDTGFIGTALLVALSAGLLRRGWRLRKQMATDPWPTASAAGLVTCLAGGLFDGYLYHAQSFICAAVFAGLCVSAQARETRPLPMLASLARGRNFAMILAGTVLMLHGYLVYMFSHRVAIPPPEGATATLARNFPSWNYGLQRWLDAWGKTDLAIAIEWSDWACEQGSNYGFFYYYSAVQYMRIGQLDIALQRVRDGRDAAHHTITPYLDDLEKHLQRLKADGPKRAAPVAGGS